jgi:hypothetical protein
MKIEIIAIATKQSYKNIKGMNTYILKSFNQQAAYSSVANTFGVARANGQLGNLNIMVGASLRPRSHGI